MPPLPAPESPTKLRFEPTRTAGLARWDRFASRGLRSYAGRRNHDVGPGERTEVSELSPYVRHRLVLEAELVRGALDRHPFQAVEKFVQEVYWRTYWKGWLELRPAVWRDYRQALAARLDEAEREPLATRLQEACAGRTGIDGFDDWVRELLATGYLHNHARMWFASIWTHTLGLPWELGADFFLRHLIDGDPASNTLSWRWVVGLQTPGKVYLARADNVAKYTGGRYAPRGLATDAAVPPAPPPPPASEPSPLATPPAAPAALLLTEEDLHPESLPLDAVEVVGVAAGHAATERSPLGAAPSVLAFTRDAQADALARAQALVGRFGAVPRVLPALDVEPVLAWCRELGVSTVVVPYAPVGPARDRIESLRPPLAAAGVALYQIRRQWDASAWPHARRGFFPFAERIPALLRENGLG